MPLFTVTVHGWPSSLKSFLSLKEDIPYSHTGRSTQQTKRLSHSEKPMVLSLFMLLGGDKMKASFELWCWRRLLRVPWTARRSNRSILKEISPEYHWKDCCWSWNSNILATWCEELTHWKRAWCWERLKAGGEGDDRGWDGWMESPTWWTWVWASSGSWWWTGRPGVLQSMGWQRVGHDWATELTDWKQEVDYLPWELKTRRLVSGL